MSSTISTYRLLAATASIFARGGVRYAVLSPGSRSAPVALSFLRNAGIQFLVITDERSAAYTALGIARQTGMPVVLACTSGTAALNYGPAVAEAFFSQIPLIVITADRPPEWIGQADNQSIFQENIYGRHVKSSARFPVDHEHPDSFRFALRLANEALLAVSSSPQRPVHINIPLREPLYLDHVPLEEPEMSEAPVVKLTQPVAIQQFSLKGRKAILLAGLYLPAWGNCKRMTNDLNRLGGEGLVIAPDVASNLHQVRNGILTADLILQLEKDIETLQPDLLITIGGPMVSKRIKEFLRAVPRLEHWHVGEGYIQPDTYLHLSQVINMPADTFLANLDAGGADRNYASQWTEKQEMIVPAMQQALNELEYSEQAAVHKILRSMPAGTVLHLGNSLPVRHVSAFPLLRNAGSVYSNRGTSGIDGSLSAAAGHSIADPENLHLLISGDLSFMYDSNGLWNNYLKGNLKIVVLNNHGGGIFRELTGPASQPELESYFVVPQPMHFEYIAKQFGAEYFYAANEGGLDEVLKAFLRPMQRPAILELNFTFPITFSAIRSAIAAKLPSK
jgi:2-succinyl-5-enolpyruvyl-6-hydroxy-3-cyclohexene-1-carboxylate synthase